MKVKPILFALIAAAISGIAGDMTEKGLYALDERKQKRKNAAEGNETEAEDSDEAETPVAWAVYPDGTRKGINEHGEEIDP